MNKLSTAARDRVISALVEGSSINATVRMTGISKPTILKLICDLGEACEKLHDKKVRNLKCERVQCDEIWAFCHSPGKRDRRQENGTGPIINWTCVPFSVPGMTAPPGSAF